MRRGRNEKYERKEGEKPEEEKTGNGRGCQQNGEEKATGHG